MLKINPKASNMKKKISRKVLALSATTIFSSLISGTAFSYSATYNGVTYDIQVSSSVTYYNYSSTLQLQPWWGDATMAASLANQLNSTMTPVNISGMQALFAISVPSVVRVVFYDTNGYLSCTSAGVFDSNYSYDGSCNTSVNLSGASAQSSSTVGYYWAIANGYSASSVNLAPNAYALRSVYNIQSAALNAGLSYDCNVFDKDGLCLSTGGRYSTTNSPETNTTSGLLIGSYKYDKNIRLGAWVDQNLATSNTTGIKLSNSEPLFGVFGAWSERNDGLGYEVKVSAGYGDKDVAISRTSSLEGLSKLSSRGIQTVSSYGMAIDKDWVAAPYVGVKYISIKRGAYSEAGGLTYNNLRQETTSAVAGVKVTGKIDAQTFTVLSAGIEQDLNHNVGQYSATSGDTTTFNSNSQKTRPVVTAGVYYDIDKTQRVGLNATHRQEAFQSTATTSALATYTVGF